MFNHLSNRRHFLFLQGPHGDFAGILAQRLIAAGAQVTRINFNGGDAADWPLPDAIDYTGTAEDFAAFLEDILRARGVTDIVFYSYWRPVHQTAIRLGRQNGIRLHGFEEGLLRPYWVTLSALLPCEQADLLRRTLSDPEIRPIAAPVETQAFHGNHKGMLKACFFYYLGYFKSVLSGHRFRRYRTHRPFSPAREALLWVRQLLCYPFYKAQSAYRLASLPDVKTPYYLLCLQLAGDSQIQNYSRYKSMSEVVDETIAAFSAAAPPNARLVIKGHPLENNTYGLSRACARIARRYGVQDRVVFLGFGKLAGLLSAAQGFVTVNSSAGFSALFHDCPVKTLGLAVYDIPGLSSAQSLDAFFACPDRPDRRVYETMVDVLLDVSQHVGVFYTEKGVQAVIESCLPVLLARDTRNENDQKAVTTAQSAAV